MQSVMMRGSIEPTQILFRVRVAQSSNTDHGVRVYNATGDYILRIAVHDLTINHICAIEVPTASITPNPTAK